MEYYILYRQDEGAIHTTSIKVAQKYLDEGYLYIGSASGWNCGFSFCKPRKRIDNDDKQ